MPKPSEYWSEEHAHSSGKPDANLATNALQLGGIDAEDYATKKYVQDFHNNKEELLKQYIDSQDIAKLQEAKNYVDTMIKNQDFSMFAKMTDLQALSENLNAKIEACKTECQQEMNTRISAVVQDVNDNFNNVNGAISQLNSKTNELFTSVSNGKDLVADAITDKGIHTSATDSFSTMATNIRNIQTEGGGEYDENFVNTADATAKASEIFLGKTAYVKGQKLYGTFVNNDTTYPTYGTDTSNADVAPEDIALGKSAYANGQYIVGTANPSVNPEVQEIYGASVNDYDIEDANIGLTTYPDSTDEVVSRTNIAFSKDGRYCVSVVKLNDINSSEYYIESHPVNKNGLIIEATAGENNETIYKKYRYSKAELGLNDDEIISSIVIGSPGFLGYSTKCLMFIKTYAKKLRENTTSTYDYKYYLHLYTYHLNDNGVIGKEYNAARYEIQNYKEEIPYDYNIVFSNTQPATFFLLRYYYDNSYLCIRKCSVSYIADISGNLNISYILGAEIRFGSGDVGFNDLNTSLNDTYIYCSCSGGFAGSEGWIITLDNELNPIKLYRMSNSGCEILEINNQLLKCSETGRTFELYNKSNDSWNVSKSVSYSYLQDNSQKQYSLGTILITPDCKKVIILTSERDNESSYSYWRKYSTLRVAVFNIDDILNANDGDTIFPSQYQNLIFNGQNFTTTSNLFNIVANSDGTIIFIFANSNGSSYKAQMWTLSVENSNELIGIRYKNQFFRSTKPQLLSATASDVTIGKTFIGYDGSVQTGTVGTTTANSEESST